MIFDSAVPTINNKITFVLQKHLQQSLVEALFFAFFRMLPAENVSIHLLLPHYDLFNHLEQVKRNGHCEVAQYKQGEIE
jgi:hypothetical protein